MVELLENILFIIFKTRFGVQSLAEELLFLCVFNNKKKDFVAEENLGLHKRELLRYHESSPILVFEGSLPIEIAL